MPPPTSPYPSSHAELAVRDRHVRLQRHRGQVPPPEAATTSSTPRSSRRIGASSATFALHQGEEIDTQGDAFTLPAPATRWRQPSRSSARTRRRHGPRACRSGVDGPAYRRAGSRRRGLHRARRRARLSNRRSRAGRPYLLSETTRSWPATCRTASSAIGDQRLRDIDWPEPLHELRIDGVSTTAASVVPTDPDLATPAGDGDPDAGWLGKSLTSIGNEQASSSSNACWPISMSIRRSRRASTIEAVAGAAHATARVGCRRDPQAARAA